MNQAPDYKFIKEKVHGKSFIYSNVNQAGFDLDAFEKTIDPVHMKYDIETLADV